MSFPFDLLSSTILLTRAGSRAYGIHTPTSDLDVKGVCIPPDNYVTGLDVFEQADKGETIRETFGGLFVEHLPAVEGTVYDWRKFLRLAKDGNPNILDVLFCRDEDVLLSSRAGRLLRERADVFLSTKVKHTFSGYAMAQMKRIRTHRSYLLNPPTKEPTRADFGLPQTTLLPADQLAAAEAMVKRKLDQWEVDLSEVPSEATRIEIMEKLRATMAEIAAADRAVDERKRRETAAMLAAGLPDNVMVLLGKERAYSNARADYESHKRWLATRNKDRAELEAKYGYDTKHGAHLVRLMRMAEEILTTGKVNVWREGIDADELRAIRKGAWSYEKIDAFAVDADARLSKLYADNPAKLPKVPNAKAIGALSQELYGLHVLDEIEDGPHDPRDVPGVEP